MVTKSQSRYSVFKVLSSDAAPSSWQTNCLLPSLLSVFSPNVRNDQNNGLVLGSGACEVSRTRTRLASLLVHMVLWYLQEWNRVWGNFLKWYVLGLFFLFKNPLFSLFLSFSCFFYLLNGIFSFSCFCLFFFYLLHPMHLHHLHFSSSPSHFTLFSYSSFVVCSSLIIYFSSFSSSPLLFFPLYLIFPLHLLICLFVFLLHCFCSCFAFFSIFIFFLFFFFSVHELFHSHIVSALISDLHVYLQI